MATSNNTLFGIIKYIPITKNSVRKGMRVFHNNTIQRVADFHSSDKKLCYLNKGKGIPVLITDLKRIVVFYNNHCYKIEARDWSKSCIITENNIVPFILLKYSTKISIIDNPTLNDKLKFLENSTSDIIL